MCWKIFCCKCVENFCCKFCCKGDVNLKVIVDDLEVLKDWNFEVIEVFCDNNDKKNQTSDSRKHLFQFPNFIAQTCVICIFMTEAVEILTIPLLEVDSAASLCLWCIIVKPGDSGSVHKICDWTSVRQGTVCLSTSLACAVKVYICLRIHQLVMILQDFVVMLP